MNTKPIVIQWNCRGLRANYEEIKSLLCDNNSLVVALQETLLKDTDNISFKGYNIFNKTSTSEIDGRPTGGSSILIKKDVPHEPVQLNSSLQAVALRVHLHKTITICSLYIPPKYKLQGRELDNLLDQLPSPVLLLGDFNAHNIIWGCNKTNNRGKVIEDFITRQDLCVLNKKDTHTYLHPSSGSFSSIDLSICSPSLFLDLDWAVAEDQCGSDHFPIFINSITQVAAEKPPQWRLHKADWASFHSLCAQEINLNSFENHDTMEKFTAHLIKIASQTIPKSSTIPKNLRKPWFTTGCRTAVGERRKALHKFKTEPTQANLAAYRLARAKARRIIKDSKRKSWKDYVSKLNARSSVKKTWDMVRKISGKQLNSNVTLVNKPDGNKASNRVDIANTLAGEFAKNSSTNHYTEKFQRHKNNQEKIKLNFNSDNSENYNIPFNIQELKDSLNKAHDTATGPDDIHYQFLKHLPEESLIVLLRIFNQIWETGVFPDCWREATIIPVPKPGKDHTNPTNYRPISLTSCLCKTMERMINTRLVWFLESNGLLAESQSGFRHFRSTMDHLVSLESNIRNAFIRGEHMVSVFFDLEKAYDTTWKYGILQDLHEFGLRGRMPLFIKNFLSDRIFKVRVGNSFSDLHKQDMGVPQGSILSVTLFNVKINSIVKSVQDGIDMSLFVDDFAISCRSKNMHSIERQLQLCLNKIQKWADNNGFKFSQSKTVCVHFCNKRKVHLDPDLNLGGHEIPVVDQVKFLGVIFDKKLNFKAHIDYLRKKCQKSLNLLKVVSKMDWGADRKVLLRLYRSLVRSKLDYGCIVYGSARKTYLKKLDTIQNQALKICLGAFRTSPIVSLHVEAGELPIRLRREKLALQYALKLRASMSNPSYKKAFYIRNTKLYERKPKAIRPIALRIHNSLKAICPNIEDVEQYRVPNIAPWLIKRPQINLSLSEYPKALLDPLEFQKMFNELKDLYSDYTAIYTDGSKDNNKVAAAVFTRGLNVQVRLSNAASIYTAELRAIQRALDIICSKEERNFIVFSDSLSSLMALKGNDFDNPDILRIIERCHSLLTRGKNIVFAWCPSHVGIKGNEIVDKLAKQALNHAVSERKIPHTDLRPRINNLVFSKWKESWNEEINNKLFAINPLLQLYPYRNRYSRREEIVLTRLRIGHSYLTHAYLLKGEELPQCPACSVPLTIKHILLDCGEYDHLRNFNVQSMHELFEKVNADTILAFVRSIDLFFKI
jgi:ribonuclease HI